jgi:hypothetical protein
MAEEGNNNNAESIGSMLDLERELGPNNESVATSKSVATTNSAATNNNVSNRDSIVSDNNIDFTINNSPVKSAAGTAAPAAAAAGTAAAAAGTPAGTVAGTPAGTAAGTVAPAAAAAGTVAPAAAAAGTVAPAAAGTVAPAAAAAGTVAPAAAAAGTVAPAPAPAPTPPKQGIFKRALSAVRKRLPSPAPAAAGPLTPGPVTAAAAKNGIFKRTLSAVRKRLPARSLKSAKAKAKGKIKAGRRFLVTGNFVGEVIVAGERVRLDEHNFNPDRFYDVVSFHQMYFPNRSDPTELTREKEVFTRVFGDGAPVDPATQAPSLPCSGEEADILFEGLMNRFERLRNDTVLLYEQIGDTSDVRARIDHAQRLKLFIDMLQMSKESGRCIDFTDLSSVTGKDVQTEEEIRQLLRQFAFMILQARSPVAEYSERTKMVQDFIEELRRDPISEEEMNAFLALWKEQALAKGEPEGIPAILGEVLETTSTQKGILDTMLEDRLDALYKMIVKEVRDDYSVDGVPAELLETFNTFLSKELGPRLGEMSLQEKVVAVVKQVVKMNLDCWNKYKEKDTLVAGLEGAKKTLERSYQEALLELETLSEEKAEATRKFEEAEGKVTELTGRVMGLETSLEFKTAALAEAEELAGSQRAEVGIRINEIQAELNAVNAKLEMAAAEAAEHEAAAVAAVAAQTAAAAALADEKEKHETLQAQYAELQSKYNELVEEKRTFDDRLGKIQAELTGKTAALASLQAGASSSERQTAESAREIAALKTQIESLRTAAAAADGERSRLQEQIDKCGADLQAQGRELTSSNEGRASDQAAAADALGVARGEAAAATERAAAAAAEAERARKELEDTTARVASLEEAIAEQRSKVDEVNTELTAARAAVARGEEEKRAAVEAATAEKNALERRLENLTKQCNQAKEEAADAAQAHRAQIEDITNQLTTARAAAEGAEADLAEVQAELARARSELEALKAQQEGSTAEEKAAAEQARQRLAERIAGLETALEDRTKTLAENERQIEDLESRLERSQGAPAAAAAAAASRVSEAENEIGQLQETVIGQLRGLAEAVLKGEPALSTNITGTTLAPAFESLLNNVKEANRRAAEAAFASGKSANQDAVANTSTQICFMTHFITFFVKTLFFTQDNRELRLELYQDLNAYVDEVVAAATGDTKTILYGMMSAAFSLLYAGDTLYMNKQTLRESEYAAKNFIGLHVLKQDTAADPERIKRIQILWDTWANSGDLQSRKEKIQQSVQSVFGQILLLVPDVHFNPPIQEVGKDTLPVLNLLHEYPSLTYLPEKGKGPTTGSMRFTEVNVDAGFTMKEWNLAQQLRDAPQAGVAMQQQWAKAVRTRMDDARLSYADLFCIFIVMGRRYLMEIRGDLVKFKCPLPSFLAEGGEKEVGAALAADRQAAAAAKPPTPAPGPAPAPAPAPGPAPTPAPVKTLRELPTKKGRDGKEYVKSNPETFAIILAQLRRGSPIISSLMRSDVKKYQAENDTSLPIVDFIKSYNTSQTFFRRVSEKLPADSAAAITQNKISITTVSEEIDKHGPDPKFVTGGQYTEGRINLLRKFFFELMDAYVHQYNITGATTIEDKVNNVYSDFEKSFNIEIKKTRSDYTTISTKLFSILKITKESITDYCKQPPPKEVPGVYGESKEKMQYILKGGGNEDNEEDYEE